MQERTSSTKQTNDEKVKTSKHIKGCAGLAWVTFLDVRDFVVFLMCTVPMRSVCDPGDPPRPGRPGPSSDKKMYDDDDESKEIEMFSVYFFVIFFANFCGNFCIEYFSAIFCVKNVIFFAQCKILHRKMGKISQKIAIVNITIKFCKFFPTCIIFSNF